MPSLVCGQLISNDITRALVRGIFILCFLNKLYAQASIAEYSMAERAI